MNQQEGLEHAIDVGIVDNKPLVFIENINTDFVRMFRSVKRIKDITPLQKLILSDIMSLIIEGLDCFISNKGLAKANGVSERAVADALRELEEKQFIFRDTYDQDRTIRLTEKVVYKDPDKQRVKKVTYAKTALPYAKTA